ncbi:MAG: 50S ribosomal protein L31 [Anaerolineae bacterium]|nr:50S ribosomal protein L31 [Anaerolineae bacterium]
MKKDIHPKYYPNAVVHCSCGNTFIVGATQKEIHTDVCSACHPFFTGEQRIVDTAGQVERFLKRLERRDKILTVVSDEKPEQNQEEKTKAKAKKRVRKATEPAPADAAEAAAEV